MSEEEREAAKLAWQRKVDNKINKLHEVIEERAQEEHAQIREDTENAHEMIGKAQGAIAQFREMSDEEKKAYLEGLVASFTQ